MGRFDIQPKSSIERVLDQVASDQLRNKPNLTGVHVAVSHDSMIGHSNEASISWRYRGTNCTLVVKIRDQVTGPRQYPPEMHVFLTILLGSASYNDAYYSVVDPQGVIHDGETLKIIHAFDFTDLRAKVWEVFFSCGVAAIEGRRGQLSKCGTCPNQLACLAEKKES